MHKSVNLREASDAEIMASFVVTNGAGVGAILFGILGGITAILAVPCGAIFLIGWWRAFGGNVLWRDLD